jgi:hypothetical protein
MGIVLKTSRILWVAASSASFFLPLPIHLAEDKAAASVTRTSSNDKLLSMLKPPFYLLFFISLKEW